jgi:hypothetical protein
MPPYSNQSTSATVELSAPPLVACTPTSTPKNPPRRELEALLSRATTDVQQAIAEAG